MVGDAGDVTYSQAIAEVEAAAKSLRDKVVKHVIVAGYSIAAKAALAYASQGRPADAILLLFPDHAPCVGLMKTAVHSSVTKTSDMVKSGAGNSRAAFADFNQGQSQQIRVTAAPCFSYFDPDGLANMPKTAADIHGRWLGRPHVCVGRADNLCFGTRAGKEPFLHPDCRSYGPGKRRWSSLIAWLKTLEY